MKEERKSLIDKKNELLTTKRDLGGKLQEKLPSKEKQVIYEQFIKTKDELNEVFDTLGKFSEEYNELRDKSQDEHENTQVHWQMAQQSSREADKYHLDFQDARKKLSKLKGKLRSLYYK